jgi:uncharacterized membrane protein (DUF485 family)
MHTPSQPGTKLGVALSAILGAIFAVFVFAAAFDPALFAKPVIQGGTVTLWFAFGFGLIWATVLIIGFYVLWVNAQEARR